MPRIVPLYAERPVSPIEATAPLALTPGACSRCPLSTAERKLHHVCMPAAVYGDVGGLMVLSESPGTTEDQVGQPFQGAAGRFLRAALAKVWGSRPLVLDHAIRCAPGGNGGLDAAVAACRPYLAAVLAEARPERILAMGTRAVQSLTGRSVSLLSARRGFDWIHLDGRNVPVFFFINPNGCSGNRFLAQMFRDDLEWAVTTQPPFGPAWAAVAKVVLTEQDALDAEAEMLAAPWFAIDAETAGVMWRTFQMLDMSLTAAGSDDSWVWEQEAMANPACVAILRRLLRNPKARKVGSNVKFDQNASLVGLDIEVRGLLGDVRLLRKLMDVEAEGDLASMAELVGMGGHKGEAHAARLAGRKLLRAHLKKPEKVAAEIRALDIRPDVLASFRDGDEVDAYAYGLIPREVRTRYVARDSLSTARLQTLLSSRLAGDDPAIARVYEDLIVPAAVAVRQVEAWGVATDRQSLLSFHSYLEAKITPLLARLRAHARDPEFNPGSWQQMGALLYTRLGLPVVKTTDTGGASTDEEAIKELRLTHPHPVLDDLVEYRSLTKLDGTYAGGMLRHIRDDGRIHPSIFIDGARSGRTSCSDPNLQNIPREADSIEGKMARDVFVAPSDYTLLSADYSQIELRIAAMLSGDEEMIRIFKEGGDFHRRTAEFISKVAWGITPDKVEKRHRSAAKTVNFGVLYGQGDAHLAALIGCTIGEAQKVRQAVMGKFRKLDRWCKERVIESKRTGYCRTWWDGQPARRRSLWRLASKDGLERSQSEHGAFNTPIQGTASEFCLASMVSVVKWIQRDAVPAKLVLPIHDALLLEVRKDCVPEVAATVREIMLGWNSNGVPLEVDIETGPSWGSLMKLPARAESVANAQA